MLTAIIVDDEKSGRETLSFLLGKHFAEKVNVLAMASNVKEGAEFIEKFNPQLIFLDIEMPNELGLSIVEKVRSVNFEIIVTTAHKEYGIEAIKAGVCDYLLKPVDIDELSAAINKAGIKIKDKEEGIVLKKMITKAAALNTNQHKVAFLISNNKTIFVEASSIVRCEADGNYTKVWFASGKSELITKLIKDVEELLADFNFFRVHKSHLINIDHIKAFMKSEDDITMSDDSIVPLSRNIKADFLRIMNI
jgi:two-component system, LytTR family, response regulator